MKKRKRNSESGWLCADCQVDTKHIHEYYMVLRVIWQQYGAEKRMLCIGCLEQRMGRELNQYDFVAFPVNVLGIIEQSPRLQDRLLRNTNEGFPDAG